MGAIILDDTIVKSNVIVAAGAVVTQNQILESGYIYAGVPAKKVKKLELKEIEKSIKLSAAAYINYSQKYKNTNP
jgi:carbonic anhydrase/acetyltransferase-like protein (isoleucine patch superfamily)